RYPAGSLYYDVEYESGDMKSVWNNVKLFAAGKDPAGAPANNNKPPLADTDTVRLEGKVRVNGTTSILTLVLHPTDPKKLWINKTPKGMYGPSGEDGWAKGNQ